MNRPDRHIFPRFWRLTTLEIALASIAMAVIGATAALWVLRDEANRLSLAMRGAAMVFVVAGCMWRAWRRRRPDDRVVDE